MGGGSDSYYNIGIAVVNNIKMKRAAFEAFEMCVCVCVLCT